MISVSIKSTLVSRECLTSEVAGPSSWVYIRLRGAWFWWALLPFWALLFSPHLLMDCVHPSLLVMLAIFELLCLLYDKFLLHSNLISCEVS